MNNNNNTHFTTPKGTVLPVLNLKGKDYLQVAYRLVWFREEHPTWSIEADLIKIENNYALAKATIKNDKGEVIATAHKREDAAHFPDFIEKAETGSIGRALAYCGYGTQFCGDEIAEGHRIVDAPLPAPALGKVATVTTRIAPEQPWPTDGAPAPTGGPYRFKTGKHKLKTFEEIGEKTLRSWVGYWEEEQKNGKVLGSAQSQDFAAAAEYIAYLDGNHPLQDSGEEDVPF